MEDEDGEAIIVLSSDDDIIQVDSSSCDDCDAVDPDPVLGSTSALATGESPAQDPESDTERESPVCPHATVEGALGKLSRSPMPLLRNDRQVDHQFELDTALAIQLSLQETKKVEHTGHGSTSSKNEASSCTSPPTKRAKLSLPKRQRPKKKARSVCPSTADSRLSSTDSSSDDLDNIDFDSKLFVERWRQGSPFDAEFSDDEESNKPKVVRPLPVQCPTKHTTEIVEPKYVPPLFPARRQLKPWRTVNVNSSFSSSEDDSFSDELPDLEPEPALRVASVQAKAKSECMNFSPSRTIPKSEDKSLLFSPQQCLKLNQTLMKVLKQRKRTSSRSTSSNSSGSNRENLFDLLSKHVEASSNSRSSSPVSSKPFVDRHFTDFFQDCHGPKHDEGIQKEIVDVELTSPEQNCADHVSDHDSSTDTESEFEPRNRTSDLGRRTVRCGTRNVCKARTTGFIPAASEPILNESIQCKCRHVALLSVGHHACLMSAENKIRDVTKFPPVILHTIEACQEEGGERFQQLAAILVRDFTSLHQEPPSVILHYLVNVLRQTKKESGTYQIYSILKSIQRSHPPCPPVELPFSWSDMEETITNINLPSRRDNTDCSELLRNVLAMEYMVGMLEDCVLYAPATSQRAIRKSPTYCLLGDNQFNKVRQVAQWYNQATSFDEFDVITETFVRLNLGEPKDVDLANPRQNIPKILPIIQRLLELSVVVSNSPGDTSRRIAIELVPGYCRATSLHHKELLIQSCAPILRLHLVRRILEDQCTGSMCSTGVQSLEDLVKCYFCSLPPQNELTPPPTPSDDDGEGGPLPPRRQHFSAESCEELAMLLWTVVESYIAATEGKSDQLCSQRALSAVSAENSSHHHDQTDQGHISRLSKCDMHLLGRMPTLVDRLRTSLSELCPNQLSPRTDLYLLQLQCLSYLSSAAK